MVIDGASSDMPAVAQGKYDLFLLDQVCLALQRVVEIASVEEFDRVRGDLDVTCENFAFESNLFIAFLRISGTNISFDGFFHGLHCFLSFRLVYFLVELIRC